MEKIIINGGRPLCGTVEVSGAKNAAVPIILATLLINDKCIIENVPSISDVALSLEILSAMGCRIRMLSRNTVEIDSRPAKGGVSPYELVRKMRGSYYLIGAELGRWGRAYVGLPGGCDFGVRPIDQHIKGFKALGAKVSVESGYGRREGGEPSRRVDIFRHGDRWRYYKRDNRVGAREGEHRHRERGARAAYSRPREFPQFLRREDFRRGNPDVIKIRGVDQAVRQHLRDNSGYDRGGHIYVRGGGDARGICS